MEDYIVFAIFCGVPLFLFYVAVRSGVKLTKKVLPAKKSIRKVGATSNTQIDSESDAQTVAGTWFEAAVKPEDYELPTFLRKAKAAAEMA